MKQRRRSRARMPQNRVKMPQISTKPVGVACLPYPPSTNRLWAVYRGFLRKTAEAEAYSALCASMLRASGIEPVIGPVALTLIVERPRRAGDLDNRVKAVLDALNGFAYTDDNQIVALHAYRVDGKPPGQVTVLIEQVSERGQGRDARLALYQAKYRHWKMCGKR